MRRLACVCFRCERRWCEFGRWPLECPWCGSLNVRRKAAA